MAAHADVMDCAGRDILNVGFGMGIIDTEIQRRRPRSHTISTLLGGSIYGALSDRGVCSLIFCSFGCS